MLLCCCEAGLLKEGASKEQRRSAAPEGEAATACCSGLEGVSGDNVQIASGSVAESMLATFVISIWYILSVLVHGF